MAITRCGFIAGKIRKSQYRISIARTFDRFSKNKSLFFDEMMK